jgi:hypothetical protein
MEGEMIIVSLGILMISSVSFTLIFQRFISRRK